MKPSATRLIIYSVAFLDQSLKHGSARSQALAHMIQHYEALIVESSKPSAGGKRKRGDLVNKLPRLKRVKDVTTAPRNYFMISTIVDMLTASGSFVDALTVGQSGRLPFFPRYAALRQSVAVMRRQSDIGGGLDAVRDAEVLRHVIPEGLLN